MSYRDARNETVPDRLAARICIVGGGIAGITLARALSRHVDDILLIESGGTEYSEETQALHEGRNIGLPYHDLDACRLRYFGGTGNHWAGYCRSNDPITYEARPELGLPAWPVSYEELAPHISAAAGLLGISDAFFDPAALLEGTGLEDAASATDSAGDVFVAVNQIAALEKIRFSERFGDELAGSARIHVVTNLTAVELVPEADGARIGLVRCRTLNGRRIEVRAGAVVLATHAIETARLLLASNGAEPAGIGNGHDLVGRFFMEHPYLHASILVPAPGFPDGLRRRPANSRMRFVGFSLSAEAMRRQGVLAYNCYFSHQLEKSGTEQALERLQAAEGGATQLLDDVQTILSEPGFLMHKLRRRLGSAAPELLVLEHMIEQMPDPASRVQLSATERDALDQPRVELDWRLGAEDLRCLRLGQETMIQEFGALGLGRVWAETIDAEMIPERVIGHYHHYGTTRMGATPRDGVVDRDLRVFGKHNLWICSSSVFPRGGAHGPTLHIIGFAMRLAERLRTELDA